MEKIIEYLVVSQGKIGLKINSSHLKLKFAKAAKKRYETNGGSYRIIKIVDRCY